MAYKSRLETWDIKGIEIHELAKEHRDMDEKEFNALQLSIENSGQIIPIVAYRGKIVDGRHRLRALTNLGETKVKVEIINNNLSIKDVREVVIGTEVRRADNVLQRSIKAYQYYKEGNNTMDEVAIKFSIGRTDISRIKTLEAKVGSEIIDKIYNDKHLWIGGKKYTQSQKMLQALTVVVKPEPEVRDQTDNEKSIINLLGQLYISGNLVSLAYIRTVTVDMINKLNDV